MLLWIVESSVSLGKFIVTFKWDIFAFELLAFPMFTFGE